MKEIHKDIEGGFTIIVKEFDLMRAKIILMEGALKYMANEKELNVHYARKLAATVLKQCES